MKNLTATLVFTSVLAFSPSLYAGSCGGGDHTHSAQEKAMSIFNKADNNSDGFINAGEFNAAKLSKYGSTFTTLDLNKDKQISKEEYMEVFNRHHRKKSAGA